LKEVVISAIDDSHPHRRSLEPASSIESGEAAAEYEDVRKAGLPSLRLHWMPFHNQRPMVWRRQRAKRITSSTGGMASSSA
jgi:hypothetical protein